jgi:hypothetical protein
MGTGFEKKKRDFSVNTEIFFRIKTETYRDSPRKKLEKYRDFRQKSAFKSLRNAKFVSFQ